MLGRRSAKTVLQNLGVAPERIRLGRHILGFKPEWLPANQRVDNRGLAN